ncbi:MAG: proline/glycine betaine ABC transporter permease [Dehalococcoidales bacterium]|jgi:glycine betaine/proline transport system permease protein|nr:proline/glycine betaine ABC transporter permease [Dehalococcoidales bacterium]
MQKNCGFARSPTVVKITISIIVVAILMVTVATLYNNVPPDGTPGAAINFPKEWNLGWETMKWIDDVVDWVVINWEPFFEIIRDIVLGILLPFRDFLQWLPWWLVIVGTGLVAWRIVGTKFGIITIGFLGFMSVMGMIDLLMLTLAITLTATLLCVVLGIPVGIAAAQSNRFNEVLRPILDGMQTMPSFVYLIPALMLFGLGTTPAVMSTVIYSIAPIIRLTNLGIRQVDPSVVEAGKSFGATPWQLLTKVQVPLAMPTILAGLNQTVMMALAMVVIASMIGAQGLGAQVLEGIARLEIGRGFIAGISIVFTAIILDRISQKLAKRPETQPVT